MFSKSPAITLISVLALASASPMLSERQNGVTCQTSSGSATTEDVTLVINELGGRGGKCPQTNPNASDCTTLVTQESGAIGICGGTDDDDSALDCSEVAEYANQIQQTCLSDGRAGGTYTVSASKRVIVFNSSDSKKLNAEMAGL